MSRPRALLSAAAGLLAALALLVFIVLPRWVRADSFRPEAEERLSAALGRPVTLGSLRLSIGAGFGLRSAGLQVGEAAAGRPEDAATIEAREAGVGVALWPLLHRRLVVRSFVVEDGTVRTGSGTLASGVRFAGRIRIAPDGTVGSKGSLAGRWNILPGHPEGSLEYAAEIRNGELSVERCSAVIGPATFLARGDIAGLRNGAPRFRFEGSGAFGESSFGGKLEGGLRNGDAEVRFDLASPSIDLAPILARGGGAATVHDLALHRLVARGEFRAGELRCTEASFELSGGEHQGTIRLRPLEDAAPFELDSRLVGVSLDRLGASLTRDRPSALRGTGDLELALRGSAPGGRPVGSSVQGTARLAIRNGSIARIGVLNEVRRLVERSGSPRDGEKDTPFRSMSATFRIENGIGRTDDLAVRSDDLDLDGRGSVGLDGALDLDLVVSFSKASSADLVERNPKLGFRVGSDGRLTVPLMMAGNVASPEVRLDVDQVLSEGVERLLGDKKKNWLKKILGGR